MATHTAAADKLPKKWSVSQSVSQFTARAPPPPGSQSGSAAPERVDHPPDKKIRRDTSDPNALL